MYGGTIQPTDCGDVWAETPDFGLRSLETASQDRPGREFIDHQVV